MPTLFITIYFDIEQKKKHSTLLQEPAVLTSPVLGKDKIVNN